MRRTLPQVADRVLWRRLRARAVPRSYAADFAAVAALEGMPAAAAVGGGG